MPIVFPAPDHLASSSPWKWVPTLYIAEGLPYIAVNTLSVLLYFNLGIPKDEMAFYTSWLYLPWVVKPFWSPFVDLIGTKRGWTLAMQFLMAGCMAAIGLAIPASFFFSVTLVAFWLMAFFSATHDIAADGYYMLELDTRQQAAFVGVRSTFYRLASIMGQGGLVMLAGWMERSGMGVSGAWAITFIGLSLFFLALGLYHLWGMPVSAADRRQIGGRSGGDILRGFGESFATFFAKPGVWYALAFMLLYRLPEALCLKLSGPFLLDSVNEGGLGLDKVQLGMVNGIVGVGCLLGGGIAGGIAIARGGLRRWMWPMALALTLPCAVYWYMAVYPGLSLGWVAVMLGAEQFGYGFGFAAFMMYLMEFSRGYMQTSHYAFCTAFMALGMMLPGMAAGWLYDCLSHMEVFGSCSPQGYVNFFTFVMVACLFTYLGCLLGLRGLPGK